MQNNEIEQTLESRKMRLVSAHEKKRRQMRSELIIDYAKDYVAENDLNRNTMPPINHAQIHKKMHLLCKLIEIIGE